jgi:hypothetical protein
VEREAANDPRLPNDANDPTLPTDSTDPILPIDRIELSDPMESSELRDHSDRQDVLSEAMSASLGQAAKSPPGATRRAEKTPSASVDRRPLVIGEDTATLVRCRS